MEKGGKMMGRESEWEEIIKEIAAGGEAVKRAREFMEDVVLEATRVSHEAEVKFYIDTLAEVKAGQVVCQQSLARAREDLGKSREEESSRYSEFKGLRHSICRVLGILLPTPPMTVVGEISLEERVKEVLEILQTALQNDR